MSDDAEVIERLHEVCAALHELEPGDTLTARQVDIAAATVAMVAKVISERQAEDAIRQAIDRDSPDDDHR